MKTFGGNRLQQDKSIQINHQAALKWVLDDPNVTTTIPGMTTFDQMDLNFRVMSQMKMTGAEKKELTLASLLPGTLYCQNCRTCLSGCPQGVEIPELMRAYMYLEGYGNHIQADITLSHLPENQGLDRCGSCSACSSQCVHGIDISSRIKSLLKQNNNYC